MNTGRGTDSLRIRSVPSRALQRYKLVVRDHNGKVHQIHEVYRNDIQRKVLPELDAGYSVTITEL